jgi:glycosyltransferase involved in cell wall biosynthesis
MKILLVSISTYLPSLTGANKANRLTLEQLAARGHQCHAVTGLWHGAPIDNTTALRTYLQNHGIQFDAPRAEETCYSLKDVRVRAIDGISPLRFSLEAEIKTFTPDWILVSGGEPSDFLLEHCLKLSPQNVVSVVHATLALPFGPGAFQPNERRMSLLRRVRSLIVPSQSVQRYIRRWANMESFLFRFPVYGNPPFPVYENSPEKLVLMINPCALKGIAIFEQIARQLPDLPFGAVPTWGTNAEDRSVLANIPNVKLIDPCDDIDEILSRAAILLVPSLWDEALGVVAIEGMLRGIPVITSDVGGLPEAGRGVSEVIPVEKIRQYHKAFDERYMPKPVLEKQMIEPWKKAVLRLVGDPKLYKSVAIRSRAAAGAFVREATVEKLESFLSKMQSDDDHGRFHPRSTDCQWMPEGAD